MNIVIAEPISDRLNELVRVKDKNWKIYDDRPESTEIFIERIKDAEGASSYSVRYSREVLEACPKLKYVAIPAVGASFFIDMDAARERGITVMNCPGYNARAVAELAVGFMIDLVRFVAPEHAKIASGAWNFALPAGHLLQGKTIGLMGYGNVGKTIERLLKCWDMTVQHIDSSSRTEEIDDLMKVSDIVVVCCPLTDATRNLVDGRRIALMKQGAVIINVGRGGVINEDALYEALQNGHIAGAALDVFEHEPVENTDLMDSIQRFTELPNVICTPHLAGTSEESRITLGEMIFESLESCENGSPRHVYVDS